MYVCPGLRTGRRITYPSLVLSLLGHWDTMSIDTDSRINLQARENHMITWVYGLDSDFSHSSWLATNKAETVVAFRCPWFPNAVWPRYLFTLKINSDHSINTDVQGLIQILRTWCITNQVWLLLKKLYINALHNELAQSYYFVLDLGNDPFCQYHNDNWYDIMSYILQSRQNDGHHVRSLTQ